jgi:hypothetical protein
LIKQFTPSSSSSSSASSSNVNSNGTVSYFLAVNAERLYLSRGMDMDPNRYAIDQDNSPLKTTNITDINTLTLTSSFSSSSSSSSNNNNGGVGGKFVTIRFVSPGDFLEWHSEIACALATLILQPILYR